MNNSAVDSAEDVVVEHPITLDPSTLRNNGHTNTRNRCWREISRHWKDHFKSDLRSDQDHRQKKDLRSDQDQHFLKNDLDLLITIKDHFLPQKSPFE
jgi:hypothetical protein